MRKLSRSPPATIALAMLLSCLAIPALAIITRHDRDEQKFLELARDFPATASIHPANQAQRLRGMGTLIAPHWVLTAAHVAVGTRPGDSVEVSGTISKVESVILHPAWHQVADLKNDIALVHLGNDQYL